MVIIMKNDFIGIECIPVGTAGEKIIDDACIVVEGGGFRGVYSSGVLDALMENNINVGCLVGVSAGALNGLNYISGQIGRCTRIDLKFRHDDRFVGMRAFKRDKGIVGFSYLFNEINEYEPFDFDRFNTTPRRFVAVATNCLTGKAEFFEKDTFPDILQAVRASSTLPYLSKPVYLNNIPYFDGGCSCRIPYRWAIDNGYRKILVVKNQNSEYRIKNPINLKCLIEHSYRDYPNLTKVLAECDEHYNRECDEIAQLEESGELFVFSPSKKLKIDTFESDISKLLKLYFLGYNDTKRRIGELISYLDAKNKTYYKENCSKDGYKIIL